LAEAINKYIKVKIIIHIDRKIQMPIKQLTKELKEVNKVLGTYVNYTTKKIDTKTIILIADRAILF
jgi:hypothetical protein